MKDEQSLPSSAPAFKCADCGTGINEGEFKTFGVCDACFNKGVSQKLWELKKKKESEWISIKEKLPEISQPYDGKKEWGQNKVLCYSPSTIGISTGYYFGGNDPMNGWSFMGVTHWMPLPKPPQI